MVGNPIKDGVSLQEDNCPECGGRLTRVNGEEQCVACGLVTEPQTLDYENQAKDWLTREKDGFGFGVYRFEEIEESLSHPQILGSPKPTDEDAHEAVVALRRIAMTLGVDETLAGVLARARAVLLEVVGRDIFDGLSAEAVACGSLCVAWRALGRPCPPNDIARVSHESTEAVTEATTRIESCELVSVADIRPTGSFRDRAPEHGETVLFVGANAHAD